MALYEKWLLLFCVYLFSCLCSVLKKYFSFMFHSWLMLKKKCFSCVPCLLLMQIVCILWWASQINKKPQTNTQKNKGVCRVMVYTVCVTIQLCSAVTFTGNDWAMRERLHFFFYTGQVLPVELSGKLCCDISNRMPPALPHLLSYPGWWPQAVKGSQELIKGIVAMAIMGQQSN